MRISDEKLQAKLGWKPHAGQQKILESDAREKIIAAGRRWGKTYYASYEVTKMALQPNKLIFIVAPDYNLTEMVLTQTLHFLSKVTNKYSLVKKPVPMIRLGNGTRIECKSGENPRGILGKATDLNIVDEAALLADDIWFRYLKPTTLDKKAKTIMISTPNGLNYYHDLWKKAGKGRFHFTTYDNPYIPREEIEKIKEVTPEALFNQEYLAKFTSGAGSAFGNLDDLIDGDMEEPNESDSYVMGVDLAKHVDFTGIVVLRRRDKKVVYVEKFQGLDYNLIEGKILAISKKYNGATPYIDSSGVGDPIVGSLQRKMYVFPVSMHSAKAKQQLIEKLQLFCVKKQIKLCDCPELLEELAQFQFKMTGAGYKSFSAPNNKHDDLVIALALAVWGLTPNIEEDEEPRPFIRKNEYL